MFYRYSDGRVIAIKDDHDVCGCLVYVVVAEDGEEFALPDERFDSLEPIDDDSPEIPPSLQRYRPALPPVKRAPLQTTVVDIHLPWEGGIPDWQRDMVCLIALIVGIYVFWSMS